MRIAGHQRAMQSIQFDTDSEKYFAEYLSDAKYRWDRHSTIPDQSKIPDFAFTHSGVQVLADIKERTPRKAYLEQVQRKPARHFNPVEEVRHLINAGRRKFKDFDGHLCVLVLYNNGDPDMRLDPYTVFGAMLGGIGRCRCSFIRRFLPRRTTKGIAWRQVGGNLGPGRFFTATRLTRSPQARGHNASQSRTR